MNQSNVLGRTCPLCGSPRLINVAPTAEQVASGVTCVLQCECGAVITLSIQLPKADVAQSKKISD